MVACYVAMFLAIVNSVLRTARNEVGMSMGFVNHPNHTLKNAINCLGQVLFSHKQYSID